MIGLALTVIAAAIALVRWIRVAQREHYLPGSVGAMSRVWLSAVPANIAVALAIPASLIAVVLGAPAELGLIGSVALAAYPIGLGVRGSTSSMAWTPRARRLMILSVAVLAAASLALQSLFRTGDLIDGVWLAIPVVFFPAMDLAIRAAVPIERRLSNRFVYEAAETLDRVNPTIVGITGSYGKTSTKGYVRDLVEGTRRVIASPASFNNRMGLSRAVNEHLTGDAEVFVAEMGTYGPGEIADLCTWVPPSISVMTAIGPVHLERFKTEENIVIAKSEILETASVGVFNVDHPALASLADRAPVQNVWRCGTSEAASDVRVVPTDEGMEIHVGGRLIGTGGSSDVFAANLACAIAVALELGVAESDLMARVELLAPPAHRQTVSTSDAGFTIIDDTFNSNPAGAARALGALAAHGGPQARRVLVTPGMVELGPRQEDENEAFARAATSVADDVIVVGRTNRRALLRGTEGGVASVIVKPSRPAAVEWVRTHLGPGDVVLYENDLPDHYP